MKSRVLVLLLCLTAWMLCSCGSIKPHGATTPDGKKIIRIVTDETDWDQMNSQIEARTASFLQDHTDVEVEVEILTRQNLQEREVQLTRIRAEMLAGNGPDIFLLPASDTYRLTVNNMVYTQSTADILFKDVQQAMDNHVFYDLSDMYNADTALNKDGLNTAIMDSGILDGERMILPLAWDMDVLVVDPTRLSEINKDEEWFHSVTLTEMLQEALETKNNILAGCAYPRNLWLGNMLNYFPNIIDYKSDNVSLSEEELSQFLLMAQEAEDLAGNREYNWDLTVGSYINNGSHLAKRSYPVYQCRLEEAFAIKKICTHTGTNVLMTPVRTSDGKVVANVTYYGAVNGTTAYPELAYEYISAFLTDEYQWERNRVGADMIFEDVTQRKLLSRGTVFYGWPVLSVGSESEMSGTATRGEYYMGSIFQEETKEQAQAELEAIDSLRLTDGDLPILDAKIDYVRYPISQEYTWGYTWALFPYDALSTPDGKTAEQTAEMIIRELQFRLAEG